MLNLSGITTEVVILRFNCTPLGILSFCPMILFSERELPHCGRVLTHTHVTPQGEGPCCHIKETYADEDQIPDLRHQCWQAALEKWLRKDQIFKQVLIMQFPCHLELFQVFIFLVKKINK